MLIFEEMSYGKRESYGKKWIVEKNTMFGRLNREAFKATGFDAPFVIWNLGVVGRYSWFFGAQGGIRTRNALENYSSVARVTAVHTLGRLPQAADRAILPLRTPIFQE